MYICMCIYMCVYVYIDRYMYICIYIHTIQIVCMYISTYTNEPPERRLAVGLKKNTATQ